MSHLLGICLPAIKLLLIVFWVNNLKCQLSSGSLVVTVTVLHVQAETQACKLCLAFETQNICFVLSSILSET